MLFQIFGQGIGIDVCAHGQSPMGVTKLVQSMQNPREITRVHA
jgi:hypothetical protein